jgi:hypothetical protein
MIPASHQGSESVRRRGVSLGAGMWRELFLDRKSGIVRGGQFTFPVPATNLAALLLGLPLPAPIGTAAVLGSGVFGLARSVGH